MNNSRSYNSYISHDNLTDKTFKYERFPLLQHVGTYSIVNQIHIISVIIQKYGGALSIQPKERIGNEFQRSFPV